MVEQVVLNAGVVLIAVMVIVVRVGLVECTLCLWPVVLVVVEDIVVVREVVSVDDQVDLQLSKVCLSLQLHPVCLDTELWISCQHGDEVMQVIEEVHTALRSVHSTFAEHDEVDQVVLQVRAPTMRAKEMHVHVCEVQRQTSC